MRASGQFEVARMFFSFDYEKFVVLECFANLLAGGFAEVVVCLKNEKKVVILIETPAGFVIP